MSNPSEQIEIDLVGPQLWQELWQIAFQHELRSNRSREGEQLQNRVRQSAEAIIATLHSRHVGITPVAAIGLARLMLGETQHFGDLWEAVTARLRRELRRTMAKNASGLAEATSGTGFVLRESPAYTVLRLALPLFATACMRLGRSILACADEPGKGVDQAGFEQYERELHMLVESIAGSDSEEEDSFALFWAEIALTYASGAMKPAAHRDAPALPDSDPLALGLMLRLTPEPEPFLREHSRPRVVTTPHKRQRSRRLNEGGVTGYKLTRRFEDLSGIIHTELVNPELVFLDRVLNTGYLTIERPPRHQKRRHVLVVGMMTPEAMCLPVAALAKACWFDCMWRFAVFLRSQELYRSEIRWIEAPRPNLARSTSYLLRDLPILAHDETFSAGDRWMFLKALRWIPSFLNRRDWPMALPLPDQADMRDSGPAAARWCRAAWAVQRDNARHEDRPSATPQPWNEVIAEFAHVHLMLFLPAPAAPKDTADEGVAENQGWRRMVSHFASGIGADVYTSVTWLPQEPASPRPWRFVSAHRSLLVEPHRDPNHIAGRLEQIWLDRLIEDTCRE
ncbi:MAG: hypothetical protein HC822_03830 [Oscillochloris sp.]|nr:hypothetical protein [Oscillochloris sp.]